ncbi:rCG37520 [Rattus norvegicus]|uniref:RCG37520 n=1 Tax=Rattus norvegicus TaxID=10116 RepID=A6KHY7_RAT|nr:rCG37520 [Rattus norvegicus]
MKGCSSESLSTPLGGLTLSIGSLVPSEVY